MPVSEVTACVLDRPRHAKLIEEIRATGAAIRLIGDGDVAGIIDVTEPERTGIDIYLGIGGAPEGVLAAAALRCTGGQMQGRLVISSDEQRDRARRMGITDFDHKYDMSEMARGEVLFAATGVTDGDLLSGVTLRPARHHHPHRRHALVVGHGALDQGAPSERREVRRRRGFAVAARTERRGRKGGHQAGPALCMRAWHRRAPTIRGGPAAAGADRRAFLGVERSLGGRRWLERLDAAGSNVALAIAQRHQIPDVVARVLAGRGVGADEAPAFLAPSLKALMPDPSVLTDMEAAAERIADAVMAGERIADLRRLRRRRRLVGGAAGALPAPSGARPVVYIPDRLFEGYGPNAEALRTLAGQGARLIVTVDCGSTSFDALAEAEDARRRRRRHRPSRAWRRTAAGGRHGQSQPPGRSLRARVSRRGRRRLHGGGRGQPAAAGPRLVRRRPPRAGPPALARPGRARHGLRRGAARRAQPRLRRRRA